MNNKEGSTQAPKRNPINFSHPDFLDKKKLPIYINLDSWRIYEFIGWFLVLIVAGLIGLSSKDYIIDLFK